MPKAKEPTAQQKRSFYNEAKAELVRQYRPMFENILDQIYADNGFTYQRELTAEEKAEQKVDELLAKHPNLRQKIILRTDRHLTEETQGVAVVPDEEPNPYPDDPIDEGELDPNAASKLSPN